MTTQALQVSQAAYDEEEDAIARIVREAHAPTGGVCACHVNGLRKQEADDFEGAVEYVEECTCGCHFI